MTMTGTARQRINLLAENPVIAKYSARDGKIRRLFCAAMKIVTEDGGITLTVVGMKGADTVQH